jgi:hypothetical protein
MYRVPPPKEPSGCLQTVVITRMIAQILFVPMLLIFGGVVCILLVVYAFSASPLLAFGVVAATVLVLSGVARWEYTRVKRDLPPPDETDYIDPRMR